MILTFGEPWFELRSEGDRTVWVSSFFIAPTLPSCLYGEQQGTLAVGGDTAVTLLGPIDGNAFRGSNWVAFAPFGADTYRWYPEEAVRIGAECFASGPTGSVCLTGPIDLFDLSSAVPVRNYDGPRTAERTGRIASAPPVHGGQVELIEVELDGPTGVARVSGFVDANDTALRSGSC